MDNRFLQGSDNPGEFIEPGLPNIEGGFTAGEYANLGGGSFIPPSGAFEADNTYSFSVVGAAASHGTERLHFDASLFNNIYGNSNTVQPKSYTVYFIMKMA